MTDLAHEIAIAQAESHAVGTAEQLEAFIADRMRFAFTLGRADTEQAQEKEDEPVMLPRWKCRQCGCLWRDNLDGTVSLFDAKQKSCENCEMTATTSACQIEWFKSHAEKLR